MNTETLFLNLKKWVINNGGYVNDKLSLTDTKYNGRAIISNDNITANEQLFKIPESVKINISKLTTLPTYKSESFYKENMINNQYTFLVAFLLYHYFILKQDSFFYPYISLLPKPADFADHPINKMDSIKVLDKLNRKIKPTIEGLINHLNIIHGELLKSDLLPINLITTENIKWAYLVFRTRQWANQGLVPIADLLQHSNKSELLLTIDNETNSGIMTTKTDINKNNIIYDNYGIYDDTVLLCNFGFIDNNGELNKILNDNIDHTYMLKVDFEAKIDDSKFIGRLKDREMKLYRENKTFFITNKGLCISLLNYLRIGAISETDLKLINIDSAYYENVISLENEARVITWIKTIIKNQFYEGNADEHSKYCKKICKKHNSDSIEYKMAVLNLIYIDVIKKTLEMLDLKWATYIKA
jgi:hypothetical protein